MPEEDYDYIPKGGRPVSLEDMAGGQICSASGLWYPLSKLKFIGGKPYGIDMGPSVERPSEREELDG
jgi:hypothetical protein